MQETLDQAVRPDTFSGWNRILPAPAPIPVQIRCYTRTFGLYHRWLAPPDAWQSFLAEPGQSSVAANFPNLSESFAESPELTDGLYLNMRQLSAEDLQTETPQ